MKHSEILKYAKWHMGASDYLCVYLDYDFPYTSQSDYKKAMSIKKLINKRLGGYGRAIQWWLADNGHITDRQAAAWSNRRFYHYRQRWIDSLIKEYEEVGK